MDRSKEYIKMCGQAKEIQNKFRLESPGSPTKFQGSMFYLCKISSILISQYLRSGFYIITRKYKCWASLIDGYHEICIEGLLRDFSEDVIWLPRQDQLQDILINNDNFTYLVDDFQIWVYQQQGFIYDILSGREEKLFKSMEQLWLGFIMKENYNKVWNGEDWIIYE